MKPSYFILNANNVVALVYEKDFTKIVFFREPKIDIESGLKFIDFMGKKIEDTTVMDLLIDFIKRQ